MKNILKNKFIKTFIILLISMSIISISSVIQAKYILQYQFDVANINIDVTKPEIEIISIENSNKTGKANKSDIIKIKIKVKDKNLKEIFLNDDYLKVKVNNEYVKTANIKFNEVEDIEENDIYEIEITNLEGNGTLKVEFLEGMAIDTKNFESDFLDIDTEILIYNNDEIDKNNNIIGNNI